MDRTDFLTAIAKRKDAQQATSHQALTNFAKNTNPILAISCSSKTQEESNRAFGSKSPKANIYQLHTKGGYIHARTTRMGKILLPRM